MISKPHSATSLLGFLVPAGALAFYGVIQFLGSSAQDAEPGLVISFLILPVLLATVIAAVLHAEEIAHKLGEPYGTLVLTIAVTIIEVALIMSITLSGKGDPALARDTVFSVIMIVCNGIIGLCFLAGGFQYREQDFEVKGASAYLVVLTALSVLALILPNFTHSSTGPTLSSAQLAFVSVVTLLLYGVFLYIQTIRHREFFTEVNADPNDFQSGQQLERLADTGGASHRVAARGGSLVEDVRNLGQDRTCLCRGASGAVRLPGCAPHSPPGERRRLSSGAHE